MFEGKIKNQHLYGLSHQRRIYSEPLSQGKEYDKFLTDMLEYPELI